jgi:hypothetical protein
MEWILVNDEGLLNSLQRAQIISRELYNITRPVWTQQPFEAELTLFPYIVHPDNPTSAALIVNTSQIIQVHPSCSLEKLIAVFPELTIDERFALSGVIHQTQAFPFGLILPNTVTVRDEAYMVANGWFILDEE